MKLSEIDVNKKFILKNIDFHGIKKRRLYDLGFIPGQVIEKMYDSVFKNPSCYKIKDTFIALRKEDAYKIEVDNEYRYFIMWKSKCW